MCEKGKVHEYDEVQQKVHVPYLRAFDKRGTYEHVSYSLPPFLASSTPNG